MKKINIKSYIANSNSVFGDYSPQENFGASEKELRNALKKVRKDLRDFQERLYAHAKYNVLVCLQGMDSAGKDSLIREVFKDFNVSGVVVQSFKVPSERELKHDFLWRHYLALPPRGKFGVFNRTHYENVLVTRVHSEYILNENIPGIDGIEDIDEKFWERRFKSINEFEHHLAMNGTIIFKFFLHLSREEQRQRLLRRLDKPNKNWKFSPGDLREREEWSDYRQCYQEAIQNTTKPHAPWYIIPSDDKNASRLIVATILWETLKKYKDVQNPELDDKIKANLDSYKRQLEREK